MDCRERRRPGTGADLHRSQPGPAVSMRRSPAFGATRSGRRHAGIPARLERSEAEVKAHGGLERGKQVAWQASGNRSDPSHGD